MAKHWRQKRGRAGGRQSPIRIARIEGGAYEFVYPRSVRERQLDLEDVRHAKEAGEHELAVDELRWLLEGCSSFIAAHVLLADVARDENRWDLAQAHYGYAFESGLKAIPSGFRGWLPPDRPANRDFFTAGRGLLDCLKRSGDLSRAREVAGRLKTLSSAPGDAGRS